MTTATISLPTSSVRTVGLPSFAWARRLFRSYVAANERHFRPMYDRPSSRS